MVEPGLLALADVKVDTGGIDALSACRVSTALRESLTRQFGIDGAGRARELLEQRDPRAGFLRQMSSIEFRHVKPGPDAVVLNVDLAITVR